MSDKNKQDKKKKKSKKGRLRRHDKYIYTFGDTYPGVNFGHKDCVGKSEGEYGVPAHMGWLWTLGDGFKPRRGWRPGALGKSILRFMKLRAPDTGMSDLNERKKDAKGRGARRLQNQSPDDFDPNSEDEECSLPPKAALRVNRQGDTITVTVNPLRQAESIGEGEDPFVDCDPIVFRIVQKRTPEEMAKKIAKKMTKERIKCENEIRQALQEAVGDICQCAYLDVYCNDLTAIDQVIEKVPSFVNDECTCGDEGSESGSSDSAWDIEYTPPFGNAGPVERTRDKVHAETQYVDQDWVPIRKGKFVSGARNISENPRHSIDKRKY